jgi:hypothetical protein
MSCSSTLLAGEEARDGSNPRNSDGRPWRGDDDTDGSAILAADSPKGR